MLVTFTTPAYHSITMFGDVALALIELMGHSGRVPGALLAEDVPAALERLKTGIEAADAPAPEPAEDEDEEPAVALPQRALPLIELLEAAIRDECEVVWEKG